MTLIPATSKFSPIKKFCFLACIFISILGLYKQNCDAQTVLTAPTSQAQNEVKDKDATILGRIADQRRDVLEGVKVTLETLQCKCEDCPCRARNPRCCDCCPETRVINTDEKGNYEFNVTPGKYKIIVAVNNEKIIREITIKGNVNQKQNDILLASTTIQTNPENE